MKPTKYQRRANLYKRLSDLGFTMEEADKLRRIERTLHRWAELECGDCNDYASWAIERDENDDKPFMVRHSHKTGNRTKTPIADRERGALKRLEEIVKAANRRLSKEACSCNDPSLQTCDGCRGIVSEQIWFYHQTDPRGASLYIGRKSDLRQNQELESCYSSVGVAVCD